MFRALVFIFEILILIQDEMLEKTLQHQPEAIPFENAVISLYVISSSKKEIQQTTFLEIFFCQFFPQAVSLAIVNDLSAMLVDRNPSEDIRTFVNETDIAETRFHENSEPIIRTIANDTLDTLDRHVNQYLNYSLYEVQNGVGRCGPASAAINATVDAICLDVLRPFVRLLSIFPFRNFFSDFSKWENESKPLNIERSNSSNLNFWEKNEKIKIF